MKKDTYKVKIANKCMRVTARITRVERWMLELLCEHWRAADEKDPLSESEAVRQMIRKSYVDYFCCEGGSDPLGFCCNHDKK